VTELFLYFIGIILLIGLDLTAVAARTSYNLLSHGRLLALREEMGERISLTLTLLPKLSRIKASLNLVLVANRFLLAALILIITFSFPLKSQWLTGVIILLVTSLLLFWLELLVDNAISVSPEKWAVRHSIFVSVIVALTSIFLIPVVMSKEPQNNGEIHGSVTEDELKTLVDAGQEEGVFEIGERRMIYSIFQLGDTLVREIMIPRIDMLALDVTTPLFEAVDRLLGSGHSRVPVYEENVDHLLGLLYAKDLLRIWREGNKTNSLRDMLRPAYFVPEAKKVDELLAEMQNQRIHMAIVVDEYGGVAGLVTLEDIVEEIIGEIQDEYDQGEEAPFQKLTDGSYLFQGRIDLDDFNELMGCDLPSVESDTLGGYIYSRLGRVPVAGEKLLYGDLLLTVEQVSAHRIRKVGAKWMPPGEKEEENGHAE